MKEKLHILVPKLHFNAVEIFTFPVIIKLALLYDLVEQKSSVISFQ